MEERYFDDISLIDYIDRGDFITRVERLREYFDEIFFNIDPTFEDKATDASGQEVFDWWDHRSLPEDLPPDVPMDPWDVRLSFIRMYQMQLIMNACLEGSYDIPKEFYKKENRYYLTRAAEKFLVDTGLKGTEVFIEKDG